jgi:hypothetical protein
MKRLIFVLFISILFFSCEKDRDPSIPVEVSNEYETFLQEAHKRGIYLENKFLKRIHLQGPISSHQCKGEDGNAVAGYYDERKRIIFIDTTHQEYQLQKQVLIFHELGHAFLRRGHRNETFVDHLTPVSIMNCCIPANINQTTYQYYIDEFFNETTPYPSWVSGWK